MKTGYSYYVVSLHFPNKNAIFTPNDMIIAARVAQEIYKWMLPMCTPENKCYVAVRRITPTEERLSSDKLKELCDERD